MEGKYIKKAGSLQAEVKSSEYDHIQHYEDEEVRMAIVHARQDIVLLVSHLCSLNGQLRIMTWLLGAILIAIVLHA